VGDGSVDIGYRTPGAAFAASIVPKAVSGRSRLDKRGETMTFPTPLTGAAARPTTGGSEISEAERLDRLTRRVRNEYLEMPGLSLTVRQAERLWHLPQRECEQLLGVLVDAGFLARTAGNAFVRAGSGRSGA
jgi:hypothetical protein